MKQMFSFLKPYKGRMIFGITIKFVATICDLLIPWGMSFMFQTIVKMNNPTMIILWGVALLVFAVGAIIGNIIANRSASLVSRNATERIRLDLFAKMNYLSMSQQQDITTASLISRATSDTYNIHQFLGMLQRMGIRQPIVIIGSLVVTLFMDWKLTLLMLAMIPIITLVVFLFTKYGHPLYSKVQTALDDFVRIVREDVNGIRIIKALSKTQTESDKFEKINEDVVKKNQKATIVMGAMHPAVRILINIGLILVIYVGAKLVLKGESEAEVVLAFMTYVQMILNAILFISRFFLMYTKAAVSAERVAEVLNAEEDLKVLETEDTEEEIAARKEDAIIHYDHVNFGYGQNEDCLHDIDFKLKKGETLGIIGATGSGKSTIVNLLMRFYDVRSGAVYLDGKDVRSYQNADLKGKFGAVFQNDIIFRDTIRENVRFGRDISEENIEKALRAAQAEFAFERGLDYKLAIRGQNLSGGQRQRTYVARALAGNPEYLILDDSSSALDYKTDAAMREAIRKEYPDTTMIVVAQRVSSIMGAEKILVLDDGAIVAQGQHEELLETCEVYREIAESQMGIRKEEHSDAHPEFRGEGDTVNPLLSGYQPTDEEKKILLQMAKDHPMFKDTQTYDDVLNRVMENQKDFSKQHHYRECMRVVNNQLTKERKANKGIDKKHTFGRLFSYLFKQKGLLIAAIILTVVSNILALWIPKLSGYAIDSMAGMTDKAKGDQIVQVLYRAFMQGSEDPMQHVLFYCLIMLVTIVISCGLSFLLTVIMSFVTKRILQGIRSEMFTHILSLQVNYFDTHAAGDIISKITYDVSTLNTSLSSDVVTLASSLVTVIGSFIMMVTISPLLMVVFVVTIPLTILYTRWLSTKTRPLFRARSGKLGEMNGMAEEMIGGQHTIQAYNREMHVINNFQKMNESTVNAYYNAEYMATFNGPSVMFFANLALILCTVFGGFMLFMTNNGTAPAFMMISLGEISSFILYSKRFSGPINESANIIAELQSALAAAERVFRLLDEKEEMPLAEHEETLTDTEGAVELSHVGFSYVPEKEIIHDLSLKAEPGKVTAIVGPTGAGKTTIINLLMRFYDINRGDIYIDGKETRTQTRDSVRKAFAMVLQETWLFTGTVFENVAYGKADATLDDVIRVCKAAHIHNYIMRLPQKYDTVLNDDGTNISKGQKQLLTIARAMLLDAHMLILDEATSNVDTRTELKLQKAMLELMKGKTCFVIAHRLSTIQNADNILVVRDGDVVEQGTHDALMAKGGFYHDLYEAQWSKGEEI